MQLASPLVGTVGANGEGQSGLEYQYESALLGTERDTHRRRIAVRCRPPRCAGDRLDRKRRRRHRAEPRRTSPVHGRELSQKRARLFPRDQRHGDRHERPHRRHPRDGQPRARPEDQSGERSSAEHRAHLGLRARVGVQTGDVLSRTAGGDHHSDDRAHHPAFDDDRRIGLPRRRGAPDRATCPRPRCWRSRPISEPSR